MKEMDQKQKDQEAANSINDKLKDFGFAKEFQEYTKSKLMWQFYERQWSLYINQEENNANVAIEVPLPPCNYGLFFYLMET